MLSQQFNKIYIIQSLSSKDRKTGTELYNDIIQRRAKDLSVDSELKEVESSKEFLEYLEKILKEIQVNQIYPIIHIETHGDSSGLVLSSDNLPGGAIIDPLVRINVSSKNNLLVTIAACKGSFLTDRIFEKLDDSRAPYWGLIAPKDDIGERDLGVSFTGFYDELLRTLNLDVALIKLDNRFEFHYCKQLFIEAYKTYNNDLNTAQNRQRKTEELLTRLRKLPQYQNRSLREVRLMIKHEISNSDRERFEHMKRSFFMIDLYQENANRFEIDYDELSSSQKDN